MLGTFEGLEIGGDLLLGFQATDVSFCLIVGERDTFHESKGKPPVLVFEQAVKQVSAFCFFGLAPLALNRGRLFGIGQLAYVFELPLPAICRSIIP